MVQRTPGDTRTHNNRMHNDNRHRHKAMTNHNDTIIKEATQLTQIVNLLGKLPDTDIPSDEVSVIEESTRVT